MRRRRGFINHYSKIFHYCKTDGTEIFHRAEKSAVPLIRVNNGYPAHAMVHSEGITMQR